MRCHLRVVVGMRHLNTRITSFGCQRRAAARVDFSVPAVADSYRVTSDRAMMKAIAPVFV